MNIAVCDDNQLFLSEMEEQLHTLHMADSIHLFSSLEGFLISIDGGSRYDAVLMDIEWHEDKAGLDAAAELYKLCPDTKIIYVTGRTDRYSQQIFLHRANLSGYLTKPVSLELLEANLRKVADVLPYVDQPSLALRQRGSTVTVPLREICYIKSDNHTVEVHTGGETVSAYGRLDHIFRSLPPGFCRCHKSYAVNMSCIRRFEAGGILLKDGSRIPVSRSRYNDTKEAYFRYMGQSF